MLFECRYIYVVFESGLPIVSSVESIIQNQKQRQVNPFGHTNIGPGQSKRGQLGKLTLGSLAVNHALLFQLGIVAHAFDPQEVFNPSVMHGSQSF